MQSTCAQNSKKIPATQLLPFLKGAVGVESGADELQPLRLDPKWKEFYPEPLLDRAQAASGVRLQFLTDARHVSCQFHIKSKMLNSEQIEKCDAFLDDKFLQQKIFPAGAKYTWDITDLPPGEKKLTLYFPTNCHIGINCINTDTGNVRACAPRPRWITHGSSITHCAHAEGPGHTWPAIVARERNWDFWNMGFGGQCKIDHIVARNIANMPAERISLCLGINTHSGFYNIRTWQPAVEGFILTIRDGHPKTPLLIISPILSPPREQTDIEPTTIGLETMRRLIKESVEKFRARGDNNIFYLDGLKIIGYGDEHHMPDRLHPDAEGIKLMAQRFLKAMPPEWAD